MISSNKKAIWELVVILAVAIAIFLFGAYADISRKLVEWTRLHQGPNIEQVFLAIVVLLVGLCFFSLRSYLKFRRIVAQQKANDWSLSSSKNYSRELVDAMSASLALAGENHLITYVNKNFCDTLGYSRDEVVGRDLTRFVDEDCRAFLEEQLSNRKRGETEVYEIALKAKNGEKTFVLVSPIVFYDSGGRFKGSLAVLTDISERKRSEQALRDSERRYRILYDDTPAMFFTVDRRGAILSANTFGAEQLGYDIDEMVGMPVATLCVESERIRFEERIEECFESPDTVHHWEICMEHKNEALVWIKASARIVAGANHEPTVLIVCEDITEARKLAEQLTYQASHDALTGLVNRQEFEYRLERALGTVRSKRQEHALLYLDLDHFKIINDTCGHMAGDELLRELSGLLRQQVRKQDTLARIGGDEFGVLMEQCSIAQANRVADALRKTVEGFVFLWRNKNFSIGISIGLVPITEASTDLTDVLGAADMACYAAKERGRNHIHIYHETDMTLTRHHGETHWAARIQRALEEGWFQLDCQMINPLDAESKKHCELLLRMKDEGGTVLSPAAFLPAAERYGLSTDLDRWVINTAFDWLASHPADPRRTLMCSMNLSGRSLADKEFLEFVVEHIDNAPLAPEHICFEFTETAAIVNLAGTNRFIKKLKGRGCRFALDDFGSGFSSFAYVKNLPVDFLKIDGALVRQIADDPTALAMVRSIIEIAHVLGKRTIAKFVENTAILENLRELHVDYVQGYEISRPQPIASVFTGDSAVQGRCVARAKPR